MTRVLPAAQTGNGTIGASFREVPAVALPEVLRIARATEEAGLGCVLATGSPNQPLLDVPVASGRVGLVLCGGLNPIAAVVESGISMTSMAMSTLCDYQELADFRTLAALTAKRTG
jgi:repressor of nif and glnA expression